MLSLDAIMYHMAGHGVTEALTEVLRTYDPAFRESERKYRTAVETLRKGLPPERKPTLDEYINAYEADIISCVTYAGYLGYRANLENFHHPVTVDFVHLDTIDHIKDHLFGHFPINERNAQVRDAFRKNLPEALGEAWDNICAYFIHLECAGPKLAHYAGYVIANHLLPWVEPGYRPDDAQTAAFAEETEKYMGMLPL